MLILLATTSNAKGTKRCKALALPFKFKALIILIYNRLALAKVGGLLLVVQRVVVFRGEFSRAPEALFNVLLSYTALILRPTTSVDLRRGASN